jgi:hypothetical protein
MKLLTKIKWVINLYIKKLNMESFMIKGKIASNCFIGIANKVLIYY